MALRATQTQTCDRCQRPFKETFLKQGDNVPLIKRSGCKFITTSSDTRNPGEIKEKVVFEYEDLCDSCKGAIDSLIEKASLSPKKTRKPRKATNGSVVGAEDKPEKKEASQKKVEDDASEKPKRSRGRPSKEEQADEKPKRGRGRPPKKVEEPEEDYSEDDVEEEVEQSDSKVENLEESGSTEENTEPEDTADEDEESLIDEILSEGPNNLVEDPETGDIYNTETGEIIQTREEREKAKDKPASTAKPKKSDSHPF